MVRYLRIMRTQFNELAFRDFLGLLRKWAFCSDPIIVYKMEITTPVDRQIFPIRGIQIEKGSLEELEEARRSVKPCPWEFQCDLYDGAAVFFVAKDRSGIQHISWIYGYEQRNRLLRLGEREAEIKFCLTMPAYRRRGIYSSVIGSIVKYLGGEGVIRVFMCVHRDNHPSIRGIEKAGFERAGEFRLRKFMGVQTSPHFDTSEIG